MKDTCVMCKVCVCVHVCGRKGQRCQLVMQQRSAQLDQSESLSHLPRPFCYITNMPFTKQPASCQTDLNHTRIHIFTQPLTKLPTAQTVEKQKDAKLQQCEERTVYPSCKKRMKRRSWTRRTGTRCGTGLQPSLDWTPGYGLVM